MTEEGFWEKDQDRVQKANQELTRIKEKLARVCEIEENLEEQELIWDLYEEDGEEELLQRAQKLQKNAEKQIQKLRLETLFSAEHDTGNAILALHPGAGGTESQDWVEMLMRMYVRFCEQQGWEVEVLDLNPGDEAGIKSATILVKGNYVYGNLKGEQGVHRLVRISPFDSSGRRHTSFASVEVLPDVGEDVEVEIDTSDLRIETYRASGAGGQHVNKTDSAVRITHQPTGIVVQCQSERSQHKNKATAMRILKSRLKELEEREQQKKMDELRGEQKEIAWGSQIRSYVFHPYSLVKDLRTGKQVGNIQGVMDGNLEPFIYAYLQWQAGGNGNNE